MFKKLMVLLMALLTSIAFAAVDVNSADASQLDGVKGIGPAISAKIVAARKNGNFKDWNDFVQRVPGVGEKSAAKLSAAGLTVNGVSFNGMPAATTTPAAPRGKKPAAEPMTPAAPAIKPAVPAAPAAVVVPAAASKPSKAEKAAAKAEKATAAKEAKAEKAAKKAQAKADAKAAKADKAASQAGAASKK